MISCSKIDRLDTSTYKWGDIINVMHETSVFVNTTYVGTKITNSKNCSYIYNLCTVYLLTLLIQYWVQGSVFLFLMFGFNLTQSFWSSPQVKGSLNSNSEQSFALDASTADAITKRDKTKNFNMLNLRDQNVFWS